MANQKIEEIEGIGPKLGEKFVSAGVGDTDGLLEKGATRAGRKALAEATGISESRILSFVNMADLFRIKGVGGEYAELLVCSGVDTVKELATRKAANLADKLAEVNREKKLTRKVPTLAQVEDWIKQAGSLPAKIEH
jgi:predicted flap endonuclease-1-like 5' DNA nuclease